VEALADRGRRRASQDLHPPIDALVNALRVRHRRFPSKLLRTCTDSSHTRRSAKILPPDLSLQLGPAGLLDAHDSLKMDTLPKR